MRTSLRGNAAAYAYSVFITACFAILDVTVGGLGIARVFLFLTGATGAFALTEVAASRGFRDRFRPEPSDVVMLGSAMSTFSVAAGAGVAWGVGLLLGGGWAWFLAPFSGTVTYVLVAGLEMALARQREQRHPPERER